MSSKTTRDIPIGWATLFAGIAAIIAALIGVYLGRNNPASPSTQTPQVPSVITATADPRQTPYVVVATRGPLIITATATADEQDPPPGSIIPLGTGFTRHGITITLRKPLYIEPDNFTAFVTIENNSTQQILISWKNSFIHAKDDNGKLFPQRNQDRPDWDQIKQFPIASGGTYEFNLQCYDCYGGVSNFDRFQGKFAPSTKYLIITIDQMAGLTNMNWKSDLLP